MPQFTRLTTERDKDLVVFLIGMRINRLLAVHQWLPVFLSMLPMMREIQADPGSGLLGASAWLGRREIMLVQYWDTYDQLVAYATSSSKKHRPAWTSSTSGAAQQPPPPASSTRPTSSHPAGWKPSTTR
jgi:hypothetical protein